MYETHLKNCRQKMNRLHTLCGKISFWRLIFAAASVLFFCTGYSQRLSFWYVFSAAAASGFVLLVLYNHKKSEELSDLGDLEAVILDYQARLTSNWKQFPADGSRYLSDAVPHANDLDLFGKHSLFQYLCTASTVFGQDQLACWLTQEEPEPASIRSRQQAVAELAGKEDFILQFEASARQLRTVSYEVLAKNLDHFFHALGQKSRISFLQKAAIRLFPVITLAFFVCYLCGVAPEQTFSCFLVCAMLQLSVSFLGSRHNSRLLAPVYHMNQTLTPYRKLTDLLASKTFESPYLIQLQQTLLPAEKDGRHTSVALEKDGRHTSVAAAALAELSAIADAVVVRHNIYASLLLNSLFCYDFHCAERYIKWKDTYRDMVRPWLEAVGSVEALISLGVTARTRQTHSLPLLSDTEKPVLTAWNLKHPLLAEADAVGNDFDLTHQTCIITGSNMSGKTTFLRTIGVNLALAYAGGFCTAKKLQVSCLRICTSMRTSDDIQEGISSFYAELLRMKMIVEAARTGRPMIALIDEIYKGTNSRDRIAAAGETIKKLAKPCILTLLTTHDLELCDLEQESGIDAVNYYFTERYRQNEILFDYKIRQGQCTTTNAYHLLRMAGIL